MAGLDFPLSAGLLALAAITSGVQVAKARRRESGEGLRTRAAAALGRKAPAGRSSSTRASRRPAEEEWTSEDEKEEEEEEQDSRSEQSWT
eukprot:2484995-Pleurochrysis_carterae.AAC.1